MYGETCMHILGVHGPIEVYILATSEVITVT